MNPLVGPCRQAGKPAPAARCARIAPPSPGTRFRPPVAACWRRREAAE